MRVLSSYPVIMTERVGETADFYKRHFGFAATYESDWYQSLRRDDGERVWELAVLRYDHESIPRAYRHACRGILINFEVSDAAQVFRTLVSHGPLTPVKPLTDESFGQRHFIVVDPGGNLVDVIENIEPTPEEARNFTGSR